MLLFALIFIPVLFALLIAAAPREQTRPLALAGTLIPVALCVWSLVTFDWQHAAAFQFHSSIPWFDSLGVSLSVGVDSVALMLIALTVLLGPICVIGSYTAITERTKTYYAWLVA